MKVSSMARIALCAAIVFYQKAISPLFPPSCRFHPSCSEYAKQAVARYGLIGGCRLALIRVLKCQPFHPGGLDPLA